MIEEGKTEAQMGRQLELKLGRASMNLQKRWEQGRGLQGK